ncbi:MAG: hypothetical protein OET90_02335 [Desulfuromonadales bacterium]|nr:hypothetical protein [Desulfuromonadales bacterium]
MDDNELQKLLDDIAIYDGEVDNQGMYDVVSALKESDQQRTAVPFLFKWFEQHLDDEVGSPGPFVHFIEESPDYHETLLASLKRCPAPITVWMANRLANGTEGEDRERWLDAMKGVAADLKASVVAKQTAREFIAFQLEPRQS